MVRWIHAVIAIAPSVQKKGYCTYYRKAIVLKYYHFDSLYHEPKLNSNTNMYARNTGILVEMVMITNGTTATLT